MVKNEPFHFNAKLASLKQFDMSYICSTCWCAVCKKFFKVVVADERKVAFYLKLYDVHDTL